MKILVNLNLLIVLLISCHQQSNTTNNKAVPTRQQPEIFSYNLVNAKQWLLKHNTDSAQFDIVIAVNRTDSLNFSKMDSVIVPGDLTGDLVYYLPFPINIPYLKEIHKIIFFSYPTQAFATYENGLLTYTGPTNMGRKKDPTPTGLFYTNWKAEETVSTFNDEWNLKWNFNIVNKEGIGWHQYSLPGYPASHSCLRLREKDAHFLYNWADQWLLTNKDSILTRGTPVIVFGNYDFNSPKPWLKLIANTHALDITKEEIQNVTMPWINSILTEQKTRDSVEAKK